uniref:G domain-containing protein n=1 Tax=Spongospora subterranea TaxID=70186 RepID=A0A0H5QFJ3_9EUKA|eukprot:CRZ00808.1 hypothetical protein [Spongospora subterranea]
MPSLFCGALLTPTARSSSRFGDAGSVTTSSRRTHRKRDGQPRPSPSTTKRVLILGVGGAGKTTLFRQIQTRSWSNKDLQVIRSVIHGIIIIGIKALVEAAKELAITHPTLGTALPSDGNIARSAIYVMDTLRHDDVLSVKMGRHIARLWASPSIRNTYKLRSQIATSIPSSVAYFLDKVGSVTEVGYVPTSADYLHCTVRSSGITEANVEVAGKPIQFLDVGGRRAERKKWLPCFHNLGAIVFLASIGDFQESLEEDPTANRLLESLAVFEELVNCRNCIGVPVIVVFTKIDLLPQTMRKYSLTNLFPQFADDQNPSKAIAFLKSTFLSRVTRSGAEQVTVLTCSVLDRASASGTIRTIRDVIQHSSTLKIKL